MPRDIEKIRAARRRWYYRNKQHAIAKVRHRLTELKEWWFNYKATLKCGKCPEDHPACLEFHHKNDDKEITLSDAIKNGWSRERILEEVEKCDVLCANCHRKQHWSIKDGRLVFTGA